jgi:hypothetical protein
MILTGARLLSVLHPSPLRLFQQKSYMIVDD